jgi:hypothetical protein
LKSNLVDVEDARLAENVDVLNGQLGSIWLISFGRNLWTKLNEGQTWVNTGVCFSKTLIKLYPKRDDKKYTASRGGVA